MLTNGRSDLIRHYTARSIAHSRQSLRDICTAVQVSWKVADLNMRSYLLQPHVQGVRLNHTIHAAARKASTSGMYSARLRKKIPLCLPWSKIFSCFGSR